MRLWLDNPISDTVQEGVWLYTKKGEFEVLHIRHSTKFSIVTLNEVDSREASQALTNLDISVSREDFPELEDEDSFYQIDLIGLPVKDTLGADLGRIHTFLDGLETDVVEVKSGDKTLLIPMISSVVISLTLEDGLLIEPLSTWAAEDE